MTIAVKDAMIHDISFEDSFKKWFRKYPDRGYGQKFYTWCISGVPYNSIGNGSAMRVSFVTDFALDKKEAESLAILTCHPTHNTEEAIRGAVTCAVLGYMAKSGSTKDEMLKYAISKYPVLEGKNHKNFAQPWNAICETTMPLALACFFDSNSFDECMRMSLEMGVDCDTVCCIAGNIAEEYYHLDKDVLLELISQFLPEEMLEIVNE